MRYQENIEQYKNGHMSETERIAFEHELTDNAKLRKHYEASLLLDDILLFTNTHLPHAQPVSSPNKSAPSFKPLMAAIGSLLVMGLLYYTFNPATVLEQPTETIVHPLPLKGSIQEIPITPKLDESIFIEYQQEVTPVEKEVPKPQKVIEPIVLKPLAVAEKQRSTISSPVIRTSTNVQGNISVTFKPGFSVSSSESFSAEIKGDKAIVLKNNPTSIESSEVVNSTSAIVYQAGKNITLEPGFEVLPGGVFTASISNKPAR